ncbi:MAG: M67 family metallopeptidase [Gemmatimonadota bacterium]|nr:M67 family metallopeptidase [Gemmatimonadota bacterium]
MDTLRTAKRIPPIELPTALRRRIEKWARTAYPLEACGLLIGTTGDERLRVEAVRLARNLERERPADRYELDPRAFLRADRDARAAGLEVIGFWHSHPDAPAAPSETDRTAAWPGYAYLIVSVRSGRMAESRSWTLVDEEFLEGDVIT